MNMRIASSKLSKSMFSSSGTKLQQQGMYEPMQSVDGLSASTMYSEVDSTGDELIEAKFVRDRSTPSSSDMGDEFEEEFLSACSSPMQQRRSAVPSLMEECADDSEV
jgi:hypothetical protein